MRTSILYFVTALLPATVLALNTTRQEQDKLGELKPKVLSRKKRYLTFPDGSSFQLVFCTQNHGYLQIGDIVWFGNTAALAWQLPSDTEGYNTFKNYYQLKDVRRNGIIYYTDEDGKVIDKKEYHRRTIVNPAFAKRSIDYASENSLKSNFSIKEMHGMHERINIFNDLDTARIDFHRSGRHSLYGKLERFLRGLGWNGRQCVLKMLCESGKKKHKQGTLVDEIIRAVFTLPKGRGFASEDHKRYDSAYGARGDCAELYPDCQFTKI